MRNHDIRELVQVLIEEKSTETRCAAHRELARRAAAADDLAKAVRHYREAAVLDPTDEVSREALDRLELDADVHRARRGMFSRLVWGFARA